MERTLVLVKPDGVQRGLTGEVIARLERRGLKMIGLKMVNVSQELAEEHYAVHEGKPFYEPLIEYITSSPVVAMVVEGTEAIAAVRKVAGATNPIEAGPGTIRADFALEIGRNIVHASDAPDTAEFEVALWFNEDDLCPYERATDVWVYE